MRTHASLWHKNHFPRRRKYRLDRQVLDAALAGNGVVMLLHARHIANRHSAELFRHVARKRCRHVGGVVTYILAKGLAALIGCGEGASTQVIRQGVGGFLYLELLDASFSFDGVVGAFAMTNNLFIITLGLGAGAMFVRSFTLLLVERGTLNNLPLPRTRRVLGHRCAGSDHAGRREIPYPGSRCRHGGRGADRPFAGQLDPFQP